MLASVLVASACGGGGEPPGGDGAPGDPDPGTTPPPTIETEPDADEPAARGPSPLWTTREVLSVDGETAEAQSIPADLLDAVRQGTEAGLWTEPEGLVAALQGVLGLESPPPGLAVTEVRTPALTGLLHHAADLLDAGSLPAATADALAAAVSFFSPSQELLDAISDPRPGTPDADADSDGEADEDAAPASPDVRAPGLAGGVGPGLFAAIARPPAGTSDDSSDECEPVTTMDFDPALGTGGRCFFYTERFVGPHRIRLYHPRDWVGDPAKEDGIEATFDALDLSTVVFGDFATVGDINVVFSLADTPDAHASVWMRFAANEPCPMTIFPSAVFGGQAEFQQTVAHEAFHCVQARSYETSPLSDHRWWAEGSAEFFSNLVYPHVNDEHAWTGEFDALSTMVDVTEMAYENTVFFQYYSNRRGASATAELLKTVSDAGGGLESVGDVDGMEELWQDFIVAFMADAVLDSGSGTVGGGEQVSGVEQVRDGDMQVVLETEPLVGTRYRLEYDKQTRFVQEPIAAPPDHASVELGEATNLSAWTRLPGEVRTSCEDSLERLVVTTSTQDSLTLFVEITETELAECDPCLLGPWQLQNSTFAAYMRGLFEWLGLGIVPQISITGAYYFDFDDRGGLSAERRDLTVVAIFGGVVTQPTALSGTDAGRYTTDGETVTVSGLSGYSDVAIGAEGIPRNWFMDPAGGSVPYECTRDALTITDPDFGSLVFDRLEEIPQPESVEVEPGATEGTE